MTPRVKKILAVVAVATLAMVSLYFAITTEGSRLDLLQLFCVVMASGCTLLSSVFSPSVESVIPEEILENEEFIEAQKRAETAGKMILIGTLMFFVPLVILLLVKSAEGFFATVFLVSIAFGIIAVIMGMIAFVLAGKKLAKFKVPAPVRTQQESRICQVFRIMGMIAIAGWVLLWIVKR